MAQFRKVTEDFWVSTQLAPEDVAEAAAHGFRVLINHRPDFEEPGQPRDSELAEQARAHGLAWVAAPVRGMPGPAEIEATAAAVASADGPVLAFCRSGMRSVLTWALGQARAGERPREDLIELARDAGYDLSRAL